MNVGMDHKDFYPEGIGPYPRAQPFGDDYEEDTKLWINQAPRQGRRYQGYGNKGGNEFRFKIDLPSFDRHLNIEDYLEWEHYVENVFDYMSVLEEK